MKTKQQIPFAIALYAMALGSAQAAISIVGTPVEGFLASDKTKVANAHNANLTTTPLAEIVYNATGVSKLVVAIASEAGNNAQIVNSMSVTFNGVAMTLAARDNTVVDSTPGSGSPADFDGGYAGIFYLDNPFQGSGTFSIGASTTSGTPNGGHLTILGLAGTAAGVANTTAQRASQTTSPVSSSIVTSAANSFVMAMVSNHGNNNSAGTPAVSGSSVTLAHNGLWGSQWGSAASGYVLDAGASGSTVTPAWTTANNGQQNIHLVNVEFAVVPEPSAAMLGGLGLLALLRRRR